MTDEYLTLSEKSEFELKEKGSKFIGLGFPVEKISDIEKILKDISKKYFEATHICFAYRIGIDGNCFRYTDAGEPTGTAGKPILGVIDNHNLKDIIIVVIRYFGGKKLGTSRLTNAYFRTAEGVIKNTKIIKKIITQKLNLIFDHDLTNPVMHSISYFNAKIIESNYENHVLLRIEIRVSKLTEFQSYLSNKTNGKIQFST